MSYTGIIDYFITYYQFVFAHNTLIGVNYSWKIHVFGGESGLGGIRTVFNMFGFLSEPSNFIGDTLPVNFT